MDENTKITADENKEEKTESTACKEESEKQEPNEKKSFWNRPFVQLIPLAIIFGGINSEVSPIICGIPIISSGAS